MDIEYLLLLQDFRNGIGEALIPFLFLVSRFAVSYILLLPVFVYWSLDKRKGLFLLTAWKISVTLNALVKLTACVYRPWIRDARVLPVGDSLHTATGYSFPSGHTMMCTPIYGGLAMLTRQRWLRLFWVAAILLTGFARNFFGVHTPQDVLVGFALGGLSVWAAAKLFEYLDAHPEMEDRALLAGIVIGILTLVYVTYKPYPMDYVDGKLLVDPDRMTRDAWGDVGGLIALAAAWYVEKRWVRFSPVGLGARGLTLCIVGLIPLCWMIGALTGVTTGWFGPHWGLLAQQTILIFYVIVLWPLAMKRCAGGQAKA